MNACQYDWLFPQVTAIAISQLRLQVRKHIIYTAKFLTMTNLTFFPHRDAFPMEYALDTAIMLRTL